MTPSQIVGARMKEHRQLLGLSQAAFSALVRVGQPQVSRWERGDVVVPYGRREQVATALRFQPHVLFHEVTAAESAEARMLLDAQELGIAS